MEYKRILPFFTGNDACEFNVWASKADKVELEVNGTSHPIPMEKQDRGYWHVKLHDVQEGVRYKYRLNGSESYPDPASLSQPGGVHEASELLNLQTFRWNDHEWCSIPFMHMIMYELHTGTFTPESNFKGIINKLDYLKDLGINAIEIMPVAQYSGTRNWGYDGVYPFAVHDSYGGAQDLMELVNACHLKGMAVILDVVYNHFGPEGNYVSNFGHYFSENYSTPWGKPMNFDGEYSDGVRNFFIQNALMWFRDFHIDGLRLDAIHAIFDFGAKHFMQELAEKTKELSMKSGKTYYLIAESNLNDVRYISSFSKGGYGLDAQWSDDFHHSLHAMITGERSGYYMDYGEPGQLAKAIKNAFVYDHQYSAFRKKTYGSSPEDNEGSQFVIFSQNHDQIGNRKNGERLISLAGFEMAKLIAGCMFVTPNVPMLFMGEEYAERNPFLYFVSHLDPELNEKVRLGREKEFIDFYENSEDKGFDPASPETFNRSALSWNINQNPEASAMFQYYKSFIELVKKDPVLKHPDKENINATCDGNLLILERWLAEHHILCLMNFGKEDFQVKVPSSVNGHLERIMDSADKMWNGNGVVSKGSVSAESKTKVAAQSIVIYSK